MKFLLLGAGLMGRAIAYDLMQYMPHAEIIIADYKQKALQEVKTFLDNSKVATLQLDVKNENAVLENMSEVEVTIGSISYHYNYKLSQLAIEAGSDFIDLGGNNSIVQKQFSLNKKAKQNEVTIIADCGLAPGLGNILTADGVSNIDTVDEIHIRVGGLPQNPQDPLDYALVFSVKGLINEYKEKATIIRNGSVQEVDSLTEVECITFPEPFGKLEAFHTSGGTSTLPHTLANKVKELDYKTIRYPGHCEKIRLLFSLGLAKEKEIKINSCLVKPRDVLEKCLYQTLYQGIIEDVVLMRVSITGKKDNRKTNLTYELIDYFDEKTQLTAMMRTTAFPVSIIAQLLAKNKIEKNGVIVQEFNVPSQTVIDELKKRNVLIKKQVKIES
ncbi:MAG: saccharopine dehydrogenase C-terminal domain-containing protein [Asgard group archaeon]|nr:saccharopine dehydrogenase C-terminal domain-containing protein [Asgard group archaeon]